MLHVVGYAEQKLLPPGRVHSLPGLETLYEIWWDMSWALVVSIGAVMRRSDTADTKALWGTVSGLLSKPKVVTV